MIRSTEARIEILNCSKCAIPMRLSRVIPSAIDDVESQIFVCDRCRTETIQVVRSSTQPRT